MFLFGHIGTTILMFVAIGFLFPGTKPYIDYRYVAFGALIPDLIDKPVGRLIFAESVANGRIVAHTLVFCLLLFSVGYYFYMSKRDARILIISVASFFHLLQDQMWTQPATFLWPVLGWDFPIKAGYGSGSDYLFTMFSRLLFPDFSFFLILELTGLIITVLILKAMLSEK